jgi:predicted signal transduction protein with EAL and GGDEF domain
MKGKAVAEMNRRLASWLRRLAEAVGGPQAVPARAAEARAEACDLACLLGHLDRALNRTRDNGGPEFAVLVVGLDRLAAINAGLRHAAVGQLLQSVVRRLQELLPSGCVVAQAGRDELAFILEEVDGSSEAIRVAERILEALDRPLWIDGHEVVVGGRIGIVIRATTYEQAGDVLRDAGTALRRSRTRPQPDYQVFDPGMLETAVERLRLETDLRRALRRAELSVRYQPIVGLDTRRLYGFEALPRWTHPTRGLLPPDEFMSVAEATGLITPLGLWVLREACRQGREWVDWFGAGAVPISVNVSARHLASPDFVEEVDAVLVETRFPGRLLTLEITEAALIDSPAMAASRVERLRGLGVSVSMDDFGTGHTGLSLLHAVAVDSLKIDRSFVERLGADPAAAAMVRTVVSLAQSLGVDTVAEGVEGREQLEMLRGLSCGFAQGHLFSEPVSAAQATETLKGTRRW